MAGLQWQEGQWQEGQWQEEYSVVGWGSEPAPCPPEPDEQSNVVAAAHGASPAGSPTSPATTVAGAGLTETPLIGWAVTSGLTATPSPVAATALTPSWGGSLSGHTRSNSHTPPSSHLSASGSALAPFVVAGARLQGQQEDQAAFMQEVEVRWREACGAWRAPCWRLTPVLTSDQRESS